MWKCTRKHGLLAWHQVHRNTWHRDGPAKPPQEEAGNGLMWVYQAGENEWKNRMSGSSMLVHPFEVIF